LKALYSDARKRAAVAAGICAYLYTALEPVVLPIGPKDRQVRLVTKDKLAAGEQSGAMSRATAIAADTCGSTAIFTVLSRLAPGLRSSPHIHTNCESSIYVASGHGSVQTGVHLDKVLAIHAGDFLFVPPGAPHVVINQGDDDLVLVVSRNTAEEHVEDYTAPKA
jgi:uncharacterized RmlC-like cupin family protein